VERGVVHDVVATAATSVSVHAYSPPLTRMSFYDEIGQAAIIQMPVEDSPALVTGRVLHPAGNRPEVGSGATST
jgi:hypothetical protein